MSFDRNWHPTSDRLERYATGGIHSIERHSIEAHLLACAECRLDLGAVSRATSTHDATLRAITDRIDRPRRPLRNSGGSVQLSLASPALVFASAALVAALLGVVGIVAVFEPGLGAAVLAAVAPLVPAAAAAIAFWPATDPAGSLAPATPLAGGRLPFLRALFASAAGALAAMVASTFTPLGWYDGFVWLAPGFAFAAVVIAAATWIEPTRFACGLGAGWLVVCLLWARRSRDIRQLDIGDIAAAGTRLLAVSLLVTMLASAIALWRRDARPNWRTT